MKFAVIGGDLRQAKLAELLAGDGHEVSVFAIDKIRFKDSVRQATSAKDAARDAECVILPLPASVKENMLNAPLSAENHTTRAVLSALKPEQLICAGRVGESLASEAARQGLEVVDYFEREELAVLNAVATAEGALQIVFEETSIMLSGAKCLVIGFGRIGKLVAHRLRGMGAYVTVSARKYEDMAWIRAYGYESEHTGELDGKLGEYDVVINTVPSLVLDQSRLGELKEGCLCLDLASKPGGVDFAAAARMNVKAVWALSLPGEVAPTSCGEIIRDTVYNIIKEKKLK